METIEINKKFKNIEECKKWEEEHLKEYTQGRPIFMINHEETIEDDEVLLTSVYVC